MSPTIRSTRRFSTHEEYSIDFFRDDLIVTVTSDSSVISQWIRDVPRFPPYHYQPLVVGVGVQWTPAGYHSDSPPVSYNPDPSPDNYYRADSPPSNYNPDPSPDNYYRADSPPSNYYRANSPPSNYYYADSPSENYYADPPQQSYYSDSPPGNYYSDSPPSNYYNADPPRRSYYTNPPADTLQLCVGNRCIIIQLSHCDQVPEELYRFVEDQGTTYVGIWNSQDARKLKESKHQFLIGDLLDLRKHVVDSQGMSLSGCSFEVIVETCLGHRGVSLDRDVSMSNWSVDNLSYEQILQASIDVYVCAKLGVRHRLWEV